LIAQKQADFPASERVELQALYVQLRERIAALRPLVVAEVTRVLLEVSSLPCHQRLWSLEFAFDEDDGRIARFEATYVQGDAPSPTSDDLDGFEIRVLLPKILPPPVRAKDGVAVVRVPDGAHADGSLAARFVQELSEFGAYLRIETLEGVSADVLLL